ncbi:MAG: Ig-like domain-containing protein, partial [Thermoanaerobaculia bacterium]
LDVGNLLNLGLREGAHTLKIRVADLQQTVAELPGPAGLPVFFKCADSAFDQPSFGFIDIPTSFDYVTGNVVFQGWALDFDQVAVVEIIVDGNYVGQAQYGFPRSDVREQYPTFSGAGNSGWHFTMDTTKLSNSRHRVTARVLDVRGNRNEIGSTDFYVLNSAPTP